VLYRSTTDNNGEYGLDQETYLKGFDEGPEQCADAFAAVEQLDESHDTKQSEEVDLDDRRAVKLSSTYNTRVTQTVDYTNSTFSPQCNYTAKKTQFHSPERP